MICIVSHDSGGAEVLASYVAQNGLDALFVLGGPAISVFRRRLGPIATISLDEAFSKADWMLCGTSWQSDLEWNAIATGRTAGKRTVAFIDHWVHYRERFVRRGIQHLPDEIWVGDTMAEPIARDCFSDLPVRLVPNPYFEDIRRYFAQVDGRRPPACRDAGQSVLFVCEPISEHGRRQFGDERHWGYTEFDALRYFFANIDALGQPVARVVVRPHPAEPAGKYDWIGAEFGAGATVGGTQPLLEEIAASDVVVGCQSMAMVVGLMAGRRVVSCVPPGGTPCMIPFAQVEALQTVVAKSKGITSSL